MNPKEVYAIPDLYGQPEKYCIVIGGNDTHIAFVAINSSPNENFINTPEAIAAQILLLKKEHDFLSYDSYANCFQPLDYLKTRIPANSVYIGSVSDSTLAKLREATIEADYWSIKKSMALGLYD